MKIQYDNCEYDINLTKEMVTMHDFYNPLTDKFLLKIEEVIEKITLQWNNDGLVLDIEELGLSTKAELRIIEIIKDVVETMFMPLEINSDDGISDEEEELNYREKFERLREFHSDNFFVGIASFYILEKAKTIDQLPEGFPEIYELLELFWSEMLHRRENDTLKKSIKISDKKLLKTQRELEKKEKIVTAKKTQHLIDQSQIEELKKSVKQLKKDNTVNVDNSDLESEDICKLKEEIEQLQGLAVEKKRFDLLNDKFAKLHAKYSLKSKECSQLTKELDKHNEWDLFTELKSYLEKNGMTESLMILLHQYLDEYSKNIKPASSYSEERIELTIGYCVINNDGHFLSFGKDELHKLYNIPEDTYLSQGQFVVVDQDYCFIYLLDNVYEAIHGFENVKAFVSVSFDKDGKLNNVINPRDYNLREHQVVAVNADNEVIHVFRKAHFNADNSLKSALIRGQKVYLIIKSIQGGYFARDIETSCDVFLDELVWLQKIEDHAIIFVHDKRVIKHIDSSLFYTRSSLYSYKKWGTIEVIDSQPYINLENHERLIVGQLLKTYQITEGDYISIDEFGNYIEWKENVDYSELTIEQKVKNNNRLSNCSKLHDIKDEEVPIVMDERDIVIIGDTQLETAYKFAFLKKGLDVSVVDGLDPWHKISKAANGADYIVYVTDYANHSVYNKIKNTYDSDSVIYAGHGGANRILEQVMNVVGVSG